ncbi:MAG: 4-hydroxythreonine-4-phosphate dehydrogenase PdxA [Flavobacteriaceae bacterium]
MNSKSIPVVGISCGDPNGVGIEVILKSLKNSKLLGSFTPIIYCNYDIMEYQNKFFEINIKLNKLEFNHHPIPGQINVVSVSKNNFITDFGKSKPEAGQISLDSLEFLTKAIKLNKVDVMVTAPINKKNIQNKNFEFPGHTDYLSKTFNNESLMFMISENLKIALLTDHIPIEKVCLKIDKKLIKNKINLLFKSLRADFLVAKPKIAVLSINPHVGDDGVIGNDDQNVLIPALNEIRSNFPYISGPYSADSFFGSKMYKNFDAVLASYHDQGLIPFKTLTFGNGVNFSAGLSVVRTSPDHGTAYEIAGKNIADYSSFKSAIYSALRIFNNRKHSNK